MIDTRFFRTRKDGVKLHRTVDALTDKNGEVVLDDEGNAIMRGFYIIQNETGVQYDEAIDVENAPYTYSETDKPIPDEPSEEEPDEA